MKKDVSEAGGIQQRGSAHTWTCSLFISLTKTQVKKDTIREELEQPPALLGKQHPSLGKTGRTQGEHEKV